MVVLSLLVGGWLVRGGKDEGGFPWAKVSGSAFNIYQIGTLTFVKIKGVSYAVHDNVCSSKFRWESITSKLALGNENHRSYARLIRRDWLGFEQFNKVMEC